MGKEVLMLIVLLILLISFNSLFTGQSTRKIDKEHISDILTTNMGDFEINYLPDGRILRIEKKYPLYANVQRQAQQFQQAMTGDYCRQSRFVSQNPSSTIEQYWVDISSNGRYVVWDEYDTSIQPVPHKVMGYDLGMDLLLGTADDLGPLTLITNAAIFTASSGNGGIYPRVNNNGLVAFTDNVIINPSTLQPEVRLVYCDINNCQSTINTVDTISFFTLGSLWVNEGQIVTHDINDNKITYSKFDFPTLSSKIFLRDLVTGNQQIISQGPYPTFLNPYFYFTLYIDNSGLISWLLIHGTLISPLQSVFINLPNTINQILVNSGPSTFVSGLPQIGNAESSFAYKHGNKIFAFYSVPDNALNFWDLKYKTYTNSLSPVSSLINNDNAHQLYPRISFHSGLNEPMLIFTSFDTGSSNILTFYYDSTANNFVKHKIATPPPGWYGMYNPSIGNFNIVSVVAPTGTTGPARIIISECF